MDPIHIDVSVDANGNLSGTPPANVTSTQVTCGPDDTITFTLTSGHFVENGFPLTFTSNGGDVSQEAPTATTATTTVTILTPGSSGTTTCSFTFNTTTPLPPHDPSIVIDNP